MKCQYGRVAPLALLLLAASCADNDKNAGSASGGGAGTPSAEGGTGESTGTGGSPGAAGAGNESGAGTTFDGSCATLPGTIVYIESGDTQENLLKNLARKLRDTANITLAFNLTGSCTLTNDIYTGAKVVPNGTLKYVPSTAEDAAWTPTLAAPTCTTGADGVPIDLAISALFVESCGLGAPPADSGLALIQGPIQAYTFVVPKASEQTAIWAEEAYYAFGFGNANPLAPAYNPWNDEEFLFIRPATKSTLVATAKNIAVPPNKWKGVQEAASGDVVNAVANSAEPAKTLGILGAEVYDSSRSKGIKTLAFQAFSQSAAYSPDSTSTSFDKQNVRNGHYTLWSPTVYITRVDSDGAPTKPAVRAVTDAVLGNASAEAAVDGLADVIKVGLIPECAMQVTRSEDGGELSPYSPAEPCTCYYLSKIPGANGDPAGCSPCADDSDCDDGACHHGYCEPNAISTMGAPGADCFSGTPATHAEIIDACSEPPGIVKDVVLPSAKLEPLP